MDVGRRREEPGKDRFFFMFLRPATFNILLCLLRSCEKPTVHVLRINNDEPSIRERNSDTDVINARQIEILRQWRDADENARPNLRALILLSVNTLAAMQSAG